MIRESLSARSLYRNPLLPLRDVSPAVATSIDALAVGISFAFFR
jgi:putative Mn2+ efflux pump MntP